MTIKSTVTALSLFLILALGSAQSFARDDTKRITAQFTQSLGGAQSFTKDDRSGGGYGGGYSGGYSGPGPDIVTVEQVKNMHDDAKVALKGKITRRLGGKQYEFQDATGTITVEISDKRWQGQNIDSSDVVEIYGEVDKEWTTVEIEVKQIIKR